MNLLVITLSILGFIVLNVVISYWIVRGIVFAKPERTTGEPKNPNLFSYLQIKADERLLDCQYVKVSDMAPLIIVFHGQGETIGMWSGAQEFLAQQGCSSLCFDYAGFGESSKNANFHTLPRDGKQILSIVNDYFPHRKATFLVGFSLGASILITSLLESTSKYDGIFLCEPFYSIREIATDPGRMPAFLKYIVIDALNNGITLPKLAYQVYLLHSEDDHFIPIRHSVKLHQKSPNNTMLHKLTRFDHNDIWEKPDGGYWEFVLAKIKEAGNE